VISQRLAPSCGSKTPLSQAVEVGDTSRSWRLTEMVPIHGECNSGRSKISSPGRPDPPRRSAMIETDRAMSGALIRHLVAAESCLYHQGPLL